MCVCESERGREKKQRKIGTLRSLNLILPTFPQLDLITQRPLLPEKKITTDREATREKNLSHANVPVVRID